MSQSTAPGPNILGSGKTDGIGEVTKGKLPHNFCRGLACNDEGPLSQSHDGTGPLFIRGP
jgi:hypothetical protein